MAGGRQEAGVYNLVVVVEMRNECKGDSVEKLK